jgi:hypothetical protein
MSSRSYNGRQVVDLYTMERVTFQVPAGYELRHDGRFAGLKKKVWNFLIRKGILVQSFRDHEEVKRVHLDGHDLFNRICEHYYNLLDACRNPSQVLIGPNTMSELMNLPQLRDYSGSPFEFTAHGERSDMIRGGPVRRAFDLPVRVVPQMEGIVILDSIR